MNQNINFIPFARPSFSKEEEEAIIEILRSGWITTGKVTQDFENKIAELSGVKYALAVNSATSGLHLSLESQEVKAGDFVLTSPYTFTSTAEVIRYMGAHPLFADIEPDGFNIDPKEIRKVLKQHEGGQGRISAIMPVHIGGKSCKMEEIQSIAEENQLPVIQDCAHLQPALPVANKKDILVYSFYATKCITTGEGGMILTDNDKTAKRIKTMRFHGIDREAWDRYKTKGAGSWNYDVIAPGYKYNLPDILSALGIVQLGKAEKMLAKRRQIAALYDKSFSDCGFIKLPPSDQNDSRHLYILQLIPEKIRVSRDQFVNSLNEKGVGISVHYRPLHMMSYYAKLYNLKVEDFPESYKRFLYSFSLPIYPDLTDEEISAIINAVKETGSMFSCTRI